MNWLKRIEAQGFFVQFNPQIRTPLCDDVVVWLSSGEAIKTKPSKIDELQKYPKQTYDDPHYYSGHFDKCNNTCFVTEPKNAPNDPVQKYDVLKKVIYLLQKSFGKIKIIMK